jgi:ketosteroid isomerase-like protein
MATARSGQAAQETNKEVVRRWLQAMERRALDEAAACWASDSVNHASGRSGFQAPRGREAVRRVIGALDVAFPDRRWAIDDMIAEGDLVVCRCTVSGTFGTVPPRPPGPLPHGWLGVESTGLVPPSAAGKPYSVKHIHIFRIAGGLIAEHWAARDDLSLLLQLGAISPPA